MDLNAVVSIGLVTMVGIAAATDLGHSKIPNVLTVTGFVFALLVRGLIGSEALVDGLLGAAIGFGLFVPVFALGGLGGGDVKLLTATGAFLGWERFLVAILATALFGAGMAIIAALRQRALLSTLLRMRDLVVGLAQRVVLSKKATELPTLDKPGGVRSPYGVAIAVGAIIGLLAPIPIN